MSEADLAISIGKTQPKLKLAHVSGAITSCSRDRPKIRAANARIRSVVVRDVQCIGRFRAELKMEALGHIKGAEDRQVEILESWRTETVSRSIAIDGQSRPGI